MIHYHGTPFSHRGESHLALQGKHAMVTYADPGPIEMVGELCQSFTIDNGAFSVWKKGGELDLKGFSEFISSWYQHPGFDWYCMPDVIEGSDDENAELRGQWSLLVNSKIWGLGVPIWHMHEKISTLERLVNNFPRVALGSSGEYAVVGNSAWWGRMAEAMEVACDAEGRPIAKLHGLRMLDSTICSHLPLSSADSTNVARNIGIDNAWSGTYTPRTKRMRAAIMMERIENHASASRWDGKSSGTQQNMALFG